jgi:hypothetical protein
MNILPILKNGKFESFLTASHHQQKLGSFVRKLVKF